jgi:hypothetical protein
VFIVSQSSIIGESWKAERGKSCEKLRSIKVCAFRDTTDVLGLIARVNAVNAKPRYFGWRKRVAIWQTFIFSVLQDE